MLLTLRKLILQQSMQKTEKAENNKKGEELGKMIKQITDLASNEDSSSLPFPTNAIKMPELALVMANYFNSLSRYCMSVYQGYSKKNRFIQKKSLLKQKTERKSAPPKKPVTAYLIYYQEKVPSFQQKYPNYTISELTRLIAKEWQSLAEDQKKSYTELAANDRKRYQSQKQAYRGQGNSQKDPSEQSANKGKEESDDDEELSQDAKKEEDSDSYQSEA